MRIQFCKTYKFSGLFLVSALFACQKKDYDNSFTKFANVYFLNNSQLKLNLGVSYEGSPIQWDQGSGKIEVPEGEGTFSFYDSRNGSLLAEKKVNVQAADQKTFVIFQPMEESPLAFLDPNAQAAEEAPPAGYMKIKIANYAGELLPYRQLDVVLYGLVGRNYVPVDTIEAVGQTLEGEPYHLVFKGTGLAGNTYQSSFIDHETKAEVKNVGGNLYKSNLTFAADGSKGIYTIYLTANESTASNNYLKLGEIYYRIRPNVLYKD